MSENQHKTQSNSTPLIGIIPPMVTPLLDDDQVDKQGLERLVEHLIKGRVHGIFVLGTTGEAPSLSYTVRQEVILLTCNQSNGRLPVVVGITDCAPSESLKLAEWAAQSGASAVVAAPPYYFGMDQAELVSYYQKLADRSPLPVYLYNMPSHTKINISLQTVQILAQHPNIIGLKDSSGNAVYFNAVLHALKEDPSFGILVGPEEMMASAVLMGGHGGVNGGANMFPSLYVDLYHAALNKDCDKVAELQGYIMEISRRIYCAGNNGGGYLQGLKAALAFLGICSGHVASPLRNFNDEETTRIKEHLCYFKERNFVG
ncbi:MAG TPA: dihydrodipicolinate synthase family protein [Cyclobacteriaceae bacterium]|nr:dihydrodipicolinate synthase family protein [Cyclobacteriaceae bacterium]